MRRRGHLAGSPRPSIALSIGHTVQVSEAGWGELEAVELPATRWRYRALAIGLVLVLLGGLGAVLLTPDGEETPAQVLREVRGFVNEQRTATVTGVSESTYGASDDDRHVTVSRLSGQIRLPNQARITTEDDEFYEETIIIGDAVYTRSAESKAELASELWEKFDVASNWGLGNWAPAPAPEVDSVALEDAASFLTTFAAGFPLDLDTLFAKLSDAERVSPAQVKATVALGDLIPDEVRKAMEALEEQGREQMQEQREAFEKQIADRAEGREVEEEHEDDLEEFDADFSYDFPFDDLLTVTVGYGPAGRLDSLVFDTEEGTGDDYSKEHEEFRFTNWGGPVDIQAPSGDNVDLTPMIDEAAIAELQERTTVMALGAPPAGWILGSVEGQEPDDDSETCESVDLSYHPAEAEEPFTLDEPPGILVSTIAPGCEWLEANLPDMAKAKTVRIGSWTAKLSDDADGNTIHYTDEGLTAVLTVNGSTVVASSALPEAQFIAALRSLAPLDLATQPLPRS